MPRTFEIPQNGFCRFELVEDRLGITGFPVADLPPTLRTPDWSPLELKMRVLCRGVTIHNEGTASLDFMVSGKPSFEVVQ